MEYGIAMVRDDLASILRNSYDCVVDYMVFEGMASCHEVRSE